MKIFSWNVNSLKTTLNKGFNKGDSKCPFEEFDIVCLQEIKANDKNIDALIDRIFFKYKFHSVTHNSRSGVSIFSKVKPRKVILGESINEIFRGRLILLEYKTFTLINVYAVNSGTGQKSLEKRLLWDSIFFDFIKGLNGNLVVCGDFNVVANEIDTYNFKGQRNKVAGVLDIERYNFKRLLELSHLVNVFRKFYPTERLYTYFSFLFDSKRYNKGMMLDYFLVTKKILKSVKSIRVLNNSGIYSTTSDHLPIVMVLGEHDGL